VEDLRRNHGAKVAGAAADRRRLPPLDIELGEGDTVRLGASAARVYDVPGHTVGHIAYHFAEDGALFTADSLMALGCGRLFEGTPAQMWASLRKLAALPGETRVYSGHEYTDANARFALTVDPDNADLVARAAEVERARARGEPTVPSRLDLERATNPFLRAGDAGLKSRIGAPDASDEEAFAEIRRRKDSF
jgi:hydroxyacylglutathione hydrolase